MSVRGREIEVKLEVAGLTLSRVAELIQSGFPIVKSVFDTSTDTYWHLPDQVRGDFIRMRENQDYIQVTVKGKDKGTNIDRIEVEIDTSASRTMVRNLLSAAHGRPAGTVRKTYHVFWLDGESEHTNVSCYMIHNELDPDLEPVYIEIESTSIDKVLDLETKVQDILSREGVYVRRAVGSLYELYIMR